MDSVTDYARQQAIHEKNCIYSFEVVEECEVVDANQNEIPMDTRATSIFKDPTVDIAILTSITNKQP